MRIAGCDTHEVADWFPLLQGDEFQSLCGDIEKHGLRHPILVDRGGTVVDGRNRLRACLETNTDPQFERTDLEGRELVGLIVSLNIERRHLSEAQRAMLGGNKIGGDE